MAVLFAARVASVLWHAMQGNTSNLLAHLRTTHGKIHADVKAAMKGSKTADQKSVASASQWTLVETMTNSQKYERKGKKWKEITVTHCIAKDTLPIYSVEKLGFNPMTGTAAHFCHPQSRPFDAT